MNPQHAPIFGDLVTWVARVAVGIVKAARVLAAGVDRDVHVELGVRLRGIARVRAVVLDEVPDAPANFPPADVAHDLFDLNSDCSRKNVIRPHELDAGARVEGAGHAHGDFAGGLFDDLGLKAAAVKSEIGNARPLVVANPAFRGGPDFV